MIFFMGIAIILAMPSDTEGNLRVHSGTLAKPVIVAGKTFAVYLTIILLQVGEPRDGHLRQELSLSND